MSLLAPRLKLLRRPPGCSRPLLRNGSFPPSAVKIQKNQLRFERQRLKIQIDGLPSPVSHTDTRRFAGRVRPCLRPPAVTINTDVTWPPARCPAVSPQRTRGGSEAAGCVSQQWPGGRTEGRMEGWMGPLPSDCSSAQYSLFLQLYLLLYADYT